MSNSIFTIREAARTVRRETGKRSFKEKNLRELLVRDLKWCTETEEKLVPKPDCINEGLLSDKPNSNKGSSGCYVTPAGLAEIINYINFIDHCLYNKQQKGKDKSNYQSACHRINGNRRRL